MKDAKTNENGTKSSPSNKDNMQLSVTYKDQKFVLNRKNIANDGECALSAMRTTREIAAALLKKEVPCNARIRELIAPEIKAAILEKNFSHILKNRDEGKFLKGLDEQRIKLDEAIPPVMQKAKLLLGDDSKQITNLSGLRKALEEKYQREMVVSLLQDAYGEKDKIDNVSAKDWIQDKTQSFAALCKALQEKSPEVYEVMRINPVENEHLSEVKHLEQVEKTYYENLRKFSLEETVQLAFVEKHVALQGAWMTYNANATSSMDAIAELSHKHLLIFVHNERSNYLELNHEHKPAIVESYEVLFLTDHVQNGNVFKNVHFDRLEPVDTVAFEKAIGFVRKAINKETRATPRTFASIDAKKESSVKYDNENLKKYFETLSLAAAMFNGEASVLANNKNYKKALELAAENWSKIMNSIDLWNKCTLGAQNAVMVATYSFIKVHYRTKMGSCYGLLKSRIAILAKQIEQDIVSERGFSREALTVYENEEFARDVKGLENKNEPSNTPSPKIPQLTAQSVKELIDAVKDVVPRKILLFRCHDSVLSAWEKVKEINDVEIMNDRHSYNKKMNCLYRVILFLSGNEKISSVLPSRHLSTLKAIADYDKEHSKDVVEVGMLASRISALLSRELAAQPTTPAASTDASYYNRLLSSQRSQRLEADISADDKDPDEKDEYERVLRQWRK
jgi:hypothetical protein